jgi:hypothetical protein
MTKAQKAKYNLPAWQQHKARIGTRDNWTCRDCGSTVEDKIQFDCHHIHYEDNRDPWDYPDWNFLTLCKPCHKYDFTENLVGFKALQQSVRRLGFRHTDFKLLAKFIDEHYEYAGLPAYPEFVKHLRTPYGCDL